MTELQLGGSTWGFFRDDPSTWGTQSDAVHAITDADLGVELWPTRGLGDGDPHPAEMERMRAACADASFVSVHVRGRFWSWNPRNLTAEVDFASTLGAGVLVLHPVCLGLASSEDRMDVGEVRRMAGYAADCGVRLALENVRNSAWALDCVLDRIGDDVERTNLGICIDVGHAFLSSDAGSSPVYGYLERYRKQIVHLHIHDNNGSGDDHLPVGDGRIDWEDVLRKVCRIGYRGTAVLEVRSRRGASPQRAILQSVARLVSCCA